MTIEFNKLFTGDEKEWHLFLTEFTPVIYLSISHMVNNKASIEDITQNIYLKLTRNDYKVLRTYNREKAAISTWLSVIAKREAIDFLRKDKSHLHNPIENVPEYQYSKPDKNEDDKPKIPLDILTDRERLILHLTYDKEQSQEEITKILNIKIQSLRNAKHRALEKLRKLVALGNRSTSQ